MVCQPIMANNGSMCDLLGRQCHVTVNLVSRDSIFSDGQAATHLILHHSYEYENQ